MKEGGISAVKSVLSGQACNGLYDVRLKSQHSLRIRQCTSGETGDQL
jgi:hypothetical protein